MMRLDDWIKKVGDIKAAEILGVTPRTVRSYRRHERYPPSTLCRRIPRLTGNLVNSLNDVFGGEVPTDLETFGAKDSPADWPHGDSDPESAPIVSSTGNPFSR